MPVSKGDQCLSVGFSSLFYKITFCMSSLLFDCYLNALSVCLVRVVHLFWQHLMFLLLLPNQLSYESKVNAHLFSTEYFAVTGGYKFFCLLSLSSSLQSIQMMLKQKNSNRKAWLLLEIRCQICYVSLIHSTAIVAPWCDFLSPEVRSHRIERFLTIICNLYGIISCTKGSWTKA